MTDNDSDHSRGVNGFTTKEMLVRLETVVQRIEAKLDAKSDKRDLDSFQIRQVAQEAAVNLRLVALETKQTSDNDLSTYKHWLIGTSIGLVASVAGLVALYFAAAH